MVLTLDGWSLLNKPRLLINEGQVFNGLTFIEEYPLHQVTSSSSIRKRRVAKFLCKCGNYKDISIYPVLTNKIKTCGCSLGTPWKFNSLEDMRLSRIKRNYTHLCKRKRSKGKDVFYDLEDKFLLEKTSSPCHYCGCAPSNYTKYSHNENTKTIGGFYWNGLDRVDSTLGYTPSNVVPCCFTCNRAKSDLGAKQFQEWMNKLVSFQSQSTYC